MNSAAMKGSVRAIGLVALIAFGGCGLLAPNRLKGDLTQVAHLNCPPALAAARKSEVPAPLVVLLESNPWAMVIGSDSPAFALYEDGRAIFRTESGYQSARLDPGELNRFLDSLKVGSLARSAGGYTATEWTDQPHTKLLLYVGKQPVFIAVYGSFEDKEVRAKLPPEIVEVRDKLRSFKDARSSQWLPESIEVMIWPYDYASEPSIIWPKRWPGLDAPTTRERGEGSFSLYVPSAEFGPLKAFLGRQSEKGAVEIGGKKWAASHRFPFAHEQLWMAPIGC
ncbi:MAG: hypothetical protein ABWX67_12325 [Allosphingosinicella sp.]